MLHTPIDDMTLQEALCAPSSDVLIYDTFNAAACASSFLVGSNNMPGTVALQPAPTTEVAPVPPAREAEGQQSKEPLGRRKRRRRERKMRNREDAESQRMTHIAVERNRRRQMNEYLAALRSLMPESYVHRVRIYSIILAICFFLLSFNGDQASIVSGAIDCVKELEQQLQSLEAQKRALMLAAQQRTNVPAERDTAPTPASSSPGNDVDEEAAAPAPAPPPFARFFRYPQYVWRHAPPREEEEEEAAGRASGVANVEVGVVVDAHASVRVMAPRRQGQLFKMVAGMQALGFAVMHLNVTTAGELVLYTLSLKVEEGCALTTADEIAAAVHHVLYIIEAEATAQRRVLAAGVVGQPPDLG
ncbi:hypothetical protein PR202_gb14528 [Eleusine coracana subsp. coracana]|uniref:BHLH domain-containing protein n=1 Tax=Eleusine coracana subsp. coracana TaxID=191504 RepID=A0AAV5EVK3_ELECO|nr:hypothetical protein PR202_gb14528 [Eleusine coracana subsp. coracana]